MEMKNNYYIMRHGESEANVKKMIVSHPENGYTGYGLTEKGKKQARDSIQNSGLLETINVIISSPFLRTKETAAEIVSLNPNIAMSFDSLLQERNFGKFEKMDSTFYHDVWEFDKIDHHNTRNDVESPHEVSLRCENVISKYNKMFIDQNIMFVSHGDFIQIMQTVIKEMSPSDHKSIPYIDTAEIRLLKKD